MITFFKIVDNVALKKKTSAAGKIEFDWQPSWILTDLLKSELFPKYLIKIHHPKTFFCSQRLGNGLRETMSAKKLTIYIVVCHEES